jgi:hypothetical protein
MRSELVVAALEMAVRQRRPAKGTIHHSDHGGQRGFNSSSQRLGLGGVDGQACGVDGGVDRAASDEVSGAAVVAAGGAAGVLA